MASSESNSDSNDDSRKESSDGDGDDSRKESSDDDGDDSPRDISGDKSDDAEPDAKDQFLPPSFKDKPVLSTVTKWARKNVRRQILGLPNGKAEKEKLINKYWCCPGDFKDFSAQSAKDSPLALLQSTNSNAMLDLTKVSYSFFKEN